MTNRAINRKVVVDYLNYFLTEYQGYVKNSGKMEKDLINARNTFALTNITLNETKKRVSKRGE